jgi:predicted porin
MAAAVAGAIGALGASAAFAQSSTVTLSGSLNFNYGYFNNGDSGLNAAGTGPAGNPKVKTDALSNQESEWVVKGEENVGGGMAAYFMCSTSMDIVGGSAANMCARNSVIGLKAGWGSVDWGNMDTPAKRLAAQFDPFPISAAMGQGAQMWNATASNVSNGGASTANSNAASFSRRQANLITYNMPTMNGFDASFAWSAANEATANTSASTIQKPRLWSAMAAYTNGPLALGIAYERHVDYNPGAIGLAGGAAPAGSYVGSNDTMYTLGAGYTFMGSLRVSGVYNSINYNNITGGQDMSVKTWGIYGDWAVSGPHRIRLGYGSQGSTKGTYNSGAVVGSQVGSWTANAGAGQTGAQKLHGEYAYALSKRTELGLAYAKINNDRFSNITIGTGSNTPNFGESQTFYGMLIRHKF